MAKKKPTDDEVLNEMIAKESNHDHFKPQAEREGKLPRPEPIDPSHVKPQSEIESEKRKVKVIDPKHLKPQE